MANLIHIYIYILFSFNLFAFVQVQHSPRSNDDLNLRAERGISYASASSGILPETGMALVS